MQLNVIASNSKIILYTPTLFLPRNRDHLLSKANCTTIYILSQERFSHAISLLSTREKTALLLEPIYTNRSSTIISDPTSLHDSLSLSLYGMHDIKKKVLQTILHSTTTVFLVNNGPVERIQQYNRRRKLHNRLRRVELHSWIAVNMAAGAAKHALLARPTRYRYYYYYYFNGRSFNFEGHWREKEGAIYLFARCTWDFLHFRSVCVCVTMTVVYCAATETSFASCR